MATISDDRRAAWLEERRGGLGGSDIAKICNLSKWGSGIDVWLDKTGKKEPQPGTLRMELGNVLEPFVVDLFMRETGKRCIEFTSCIHGQGDRACMLGNLDRVVVEEGQDINEMVLRLQQGDLSCIESILECKTCAKLDDWYDDDGNFTVPQYYRTQILWYMGLVPTCKRVYVATLCTGLDCKFDFVCVERNDKVVDGLVAYGCNWWKENIASLTPENETTIMEKLCGEAQSVKEVVELYPKSDPESEFVATERELSALDEYKKLAKEIKDFEESVCYTDEKGNTFNREDRMEALKTEITSSMGEKEILVSGDGDDRTVLATFKSGNDTVKDVTDWEAVAKAIAESVEGGKAMLEELVKQNTEYGKVTRKGSRPFRVKESKKSASKKGKRAA